MIANKLTLVRSYRTQQNTVDLTVEERGFALILLVAEGLYSEAYHAMRADQRLSADQKKEIQKIANDCYLFPKELEWTNHGIRRSFRFWSEDQKRVYVERANRLAQTLKEFTPYVSFGFGSVLSLIRDNDFIPHDDDLDLIICMEKMRFEDAKKGLQTFLESKNYAVHGKNFSHFGVNEGDGGAAIDVFIGFSEDEHVSWFPSRRKSLLMSEVFPTQSRSFFGQNVPVPADAERYLEVTYGSDWRQPISNWNHPWDFSEYEDLR